MKYYDDRRGRKRIDSLVGVTVIINGHKATLLDITVEGALFKIIEKVETSFNGLQKGDLLFVSGTYHFIKENNNGTVATTKGTDP